MITTDAQKYLPQMGLDPLRRAGEWIFGAIVGEIVPIAFFCPAGRYLNAIPSNCCARVS